jgi:outer membrane protein assembly factor BamB
VVDCHVVVLAGDRLVALVPETLEASWTIDCPMASWASVLPASASVGDGTVTVEVAVCDDHYTGFDGRTGDVLWTRPVQETDRVRVGPTILALQHDMDGVTVVDLATGDVRFEVDKNLPANVAADEENLYLTTDISALAYDLETGEEEWEREHVSASGLIATPGGVFARTSSHEVLRLNVRTGQEEAFSGRGRHEELTWSDFVHTSDAVVVLKATQGSYDVSVYDAETVDLLWSLPAEPGNVVGGGSGLVAIASAEDASVTLYDEITGEEVDRVDGVLGGRPAVLDGRLYVLGEDEDGGFGLRVVEVG